MSRSLFTFQMSGDPREVLVLPSLQHAANFRLGGRFGGFGQLTGFRVSRRLRHDSALKSVVIPMTDLMLPDWSLHFPVRRAQTGFERGAEGRPGERTERIREMHRIHVERIAVFKRLVPIRREGWRLA
jgi:hypothetical protein